MSLYDAFIYQLFNILYSSIPIIIYAIIDQEFSDKVLVENKLNYYAQGIEKKLFNTKIFWSWFFYGTYVSLVLAFFGFHLLGANFVNERGLTFNFWETSTMIYTFVVIITNFQILIFSNTYNLLSLSGLFGSISVFPLTLLIYMNVTPTEFSAEAITKTEIVYLSIFVIFSGSCLPSLFFEMNKSISFLQESEFFIFIRVYNKRDSEEIERNDGKSEG